MTINIKVIQSTCLYTIRINKHDLDDDGVEAALLLLLHPLPNHQPQHPINLFLLPLQS